MTRRELVYAALALALAGIFPLAVVAAGYGLGSLRSYFFYLLVPAAVAFLIILFATRRLGSGLLFNRLAVGVLAGIALTLALDVVRLTGYNLGFLPANMPQVFGLQIVGKMPMKAEATAASTFFGYLYHFMNGVTFGVVYTMVFGHARWWAGVLYSVFFVELGMMTLPPMAKATGPFGLGLGQGILNGVFMTTLLAHIAMGVVLGLIVQRWARGGPIWREWAPRGNREAGLPGTV